jgi:hypothetical protein
MKLSDRALNFVIRVLNDKDKESVNRAIKVGLLLKKYGYSEVVISAGYLKDVPLKTTFTFLDIAKLFGGNTSSLIMTSIEADDSLSNEDKRKQKIKGIGNLPADNMAVVCADKIVELEELTDTDDSDLRKYYEDLYEQIASSFDEPILYHFNQAISDTFSYNANYDFSYSNEIMSSYYDDLVNLKRVLTDDKSYLIEFSGLLKKNKSFKEIVKRFLSSTDFRVRVSEDYQAQSKYEDVVLSNVSISEVEKNLLISVATKDNLMDKLIGPQDVIMVDSSLFDFLVLFKVLIKDDIDRFLSDLEYLVNWSSVCYKSDLSYGINNRMYNEVLSNCGALIKGVGGNSPTKINIREATLRVADTLLPIMRYEYVLSLKSFIHENEEV